MAKTKSLSVLAGYGIEQNVHVVENVIYFIKNL